MIGCIYSSCEGTTKRTRITNIIKNIEQDYREIAQQHQEIMIVGDFNAYIGNDAEGITGNHTQIGINGNEYRKMFKLNNLLVMNNSQKCKGVWTRVQGESKSILDLTVCNIKVEPNIKSIFIEEEMRYQLESKQARSDHRLTIIEYKMEYHPAPQNKRTITLVHDEFWDHYIEEISKKPNINTQTTNKKRNITY